jgi:hypothetical protein
VTSLGHQTLCDVTSLGHLSPPLLPGRFHPASHRPLASLGSRVPGAHQAQSHLRSSHMLFPLPGRQFPALHRLAPSPSAGLSSGSLLRDLP